MDIKGTDARTAEPYSHHEGLTYHQATGSYGFAGGWVLGKQTIESLSEASGYSERQLRRWFSEYLENVPEWTIPRHKGLHLMVTGRKMYHSLPRL